MNYKIKEILDHTDSSEVIMAEACLGSTTRNVIIKTVLPDITDKVYTRLYLAKKLKHARIQEMIDFGECTVHSQKRKLWLTPTLKEKH